MALATNLVRRAGSAAYYARVAVPKDLRSIVGRDEMWKSLGTKDAREAKARLPVVLAGWHAEFTALRRQATDRDLQAATWDHYQAEASQLGVERRGLPTTADVQVATEGLRTEIDAGRVEWSSNELVRLSAVLDVMVMRDAAALHRDFRRRRLDTLRKHVASGETALIQWAADDLIAREGFGIAKGSPLYRDLCQRLQRAEIEALLRAEEQDAGDFSGRPRDPVVSLPTGDGPPIAKPGESVMELFETFARENPRRIKPATIRMNREIIGWFAQHVGATFPASAIDKRTVREWKASLAKFPVKAIEVREFRGLTFPKIITANERVGRPCISARTTNKYLSALGAFCNWLAANGHLDANPVLGMLVGSDKGTRKVRPYTADELVAIFRSPLFTGCRSPASPHLPGNVRIRDHRYWLPLLALFTGARMGELAQLLVADVREERGRWIIHVTPEGDPAKTVKTVGSARVIPVHPELVRLGLLTLHAERMRTAERRLFPEIEPDARGSIAGHFSRFINRYFAKVGVKADKAVNFHSFRHGMADAFRRAGYRDEEFAFMLGHTGATTTGRYGILSEGELMKRCAMIDAVSFPGLDLSKLHT